MALLCIFGFGAEQLAAQDRIVKTNDEVVECEIIGVTGTYISYYSQNSGDYIVYKINRDLVKNIELDDIGEFTVRSEFDKPETMVLKDSRSNFYFANGKIIHKYEDLKPFLSGYKPSAEFLKRSLDYKTNANAFGIASLVFFGSGVMILSNDSSLSNTITGAVFLFLCAPSAGTIALISNGMHRRFKRKAINAYGIQSINQNFTYLQQKENVLLDLGLVSNGVGMRLSF